VERLLSSIHTSFTLRDYFPALSFVILPRTLTEFLFVPLTGKWRTMSERAALEMLAQSKSVTEVAIAVGYDSVSAFIEMFRTMLGTTPQDTLEAGVRSHSVEPCAQRRAFLDAMAV